MCILVLSGLFIQISNAQIPKEKRHDVGNDQQIDSTSKKTSQKEEINFNSFANNSTQIVSKIQNGIINWTEQYIEANGSLKIDTIKFKNKNQAKSMTTRGAVVVAQHNLFEIIKGIKVTGETTVNDMLSQGDNIFPIIDGVVKRAETSGDAIEKNGIIEVKIRVSLYKINGLASALYNKFLQNQNAQNSLTTPTKPAKDIQDQDLTGIAFNFNGKTFDPSLFPLIVDKNDNVVFDFSKLYNPKKGDFPKIFGTTEEMYKKIGFKKGIEYLNVFRAEPGRIVLDDKNIKKINWNKFAQKEGSIDKFLILLINLSSDKNTLK